MSTLPIGVFDSGMGGLTVLRELMRALPGESFYYLGDTARLPYGTKSQETVMRYAYQMASFLVQQQIKLLVVACNTATTAALPYLQQQFPHIPMVGVVEPGAQAAIAATKNHRIGLLATETTIYSGVYQTALHRLQADVEVTAQACGLFVALAEEGCTNDEIAHVAVKQLLRPLQDHQHHHDTVILGCTHFPVLMEPLQQVLGDDVTIINSAAATATAVKTLLSEHRNGLSTCRFFVTDLPERFARVGEIFLGHAIDVDQVELIDGHTRVSHSVS